MDTNEAVDILFKGQILTWKVICLLGALIVVNSAGIFYLVVVK